MFEGHIEQEVKAHVLREFPLEACGVIVDKVYIPCTNCAENPESDFEVLEGPFNGLEAVIHSHTGKEAVAAPSASDMRSQANSAVPWGILACDGVNISPITWFGDSVPIADTAWLTAVQQSWSVSSSAVVNGLEKHLMLVLRGY